MTVAQQTNLRDALANTANLHVSVVELKVNSGIGTPANSTIGVSQGTIWFDQDYVYVAISNAAIKRVPLSAF